VYSFDGKIAHGRYAQIARRANLSQPVGIAVTPKSAADSAPSRPHQRRFAIVTNVEAGCDGRDGDARRAALNADGEVVWS
jgi:hypothetical protein